MNQRNIRLLRVDYLVAIIIVLFYKTLHLLEIEWTDFV